MRVAVRKIGSSVVMTLLSCLYCNELDKETRNLDSAMQLYENSHRYEITYLKEECIEFFNSVINTENIGKLLLLADANNDDALNASIENFVISNVYDIVHSSEWKKIAQEKTEFSTDMQNVALGVGKIEASTVMDVLSILYAGKLNERRKNVSHVKKLYMNAVNYKLDQLKKECLKLFPLLITEENVGVILHLSFEHNDNSLKKCVEDFVFSNAEKILESAELKKQIQEKGNLDKDIANISKAAKEIGPSIIMTTLFLTFCGKLNTDEIDSVLKLYETAIKYKLLDVKEECLSCIYRMMNEENFVKVLILSNACEDHSLKKCVRNFIASNASKILHSREWKLKMEEEVDLAEDMRNIAATFPEHGSDILMALLSYAYCGNLGTEGDEVESVIKLYEKANKFKLFHMKEGIVSHIQFIINEENLGKILITSGAYDDNSLKICVQDFVASNASKILQSSEWKLKMEQRSDLTEDMQNIAGTFHEHGSEILMILLLYLYCGNIGKEEENIDTVLKLYEIAKKFQLFSIRKECISQIHRMINEENIGKILIVSNTYTDYSLKKCVQDFVASNAQKVLQSREWKQKMKDRPDVAEDMQNIAVALNELGHEILMIMLSFLYCGNICKDRDTQYVINLYKDTEQHKLSQLKKQCIEFFHSILTVGNVGTFLMLSETHNDDCLKRHVHDFVCANAADFLNSSEWKKLKSTNSSVIPDLLEAALRALATNKEK